MTGPAQFQVGYVAKAHGLDGEVGIRTFDPNSEVLFEVERVRLRLRDGAECDFVVDSIRNALKEVLIGFEGIADRTAAEGLVGATVFVFREDLETPSEDEVFQGDLIGLTAVDEKGDTLGIVEEVWNTGPVPNLVIRQEGRPELVVPFVDAFVPALDLEQRKVTIRPPEFS